MKAVRGKRLHAPAFAALFAASLGFSAAQADSRYAEGCAPKAGCQFAAPRFACCEDDR
ncbi:MULTISPECIES: hypothetical protein [Lysobacter]|uniref:hypothetical protein n=1 Tax=Lysobacter TaxID=68 RepID=UPI001F447114|nr:MULTISPECIES: hypothetical protein [Lysobacter]UJB19385.1 hypothetical protein L1A79_24285 [Lysobacter capsici]UJQ26890.1 hypothetical protein L2D09_15600 [Lysobacter gummosus]